MGSGATRNAERCGSEDISMEQQKDKVEVGCHGYSLVRIGEALGDQIDDLPSRVYA